MGSKMSHIRVLNYELLQGSVMATFLYNIYTSDLPASKSINFTLKLLEKYFKKLKAPPQYTYKRQSRALFIRTITKLTKH